MKVFVGGAFQGKKKAAMEKTGLCETDFLDGETCTKEELLTGKAVNHFHSYIRRALKEEREGALDAFVQELRREGIMAAVIGQTNSGNDRLLYSGGNARYLERPGNNVMQKRGK